MRKFLLLLLVFKSLISHAETIKEININGLSNITRGSVLSFIPIEIGDDFKKENSALILNSLAKTNFFSNISLQINNGVLTLSVQENPTIKFFEIKNYKESSVLSETAVEQLLSNQNLIAGKIYNSKKLDSIIEQLKALYARNGFYNTSFLVKKELDQENRIGLEIDIKEGEPARIKRFTISGSKFFSEETLKKSFDIGEPDIFFINYFTKKDQFNELELAGGIESIRNKYLSNGFLDINILKPLITVSDNKKEILVEIKINEGLQYFIRNISFDNTVKKLGDKLNSLINFSSGDVLNRELLIKTVKGINKEFSNIGYAYSSADTVFKKISGNKVDIEIKVNEGMLTYVNRIEISGNFRTQDDVIRREITLLEGQLYSDNDFNNSIKNIKRLGYFSNVSMNAVKLKKYPDKVDIFVNVTETKTGEFSVGLSHSNSTGPSFNIGIQENNFLGTGNTFKARFNNSKALKETTFYFLNPHFNNLGHSLSYGVFNKKLDASNLDISSYQINENGFSGGYGIPISESTDIFSDLVFSRLDLTCGSLFSSEDYEQSQCTSPDSVEIATNIKYSHNTLNDFYFPTNGVKNILSSKIALPLGDFNYFTMSNSYENFSSVTDNLTLKLGYDLSFAKGYNNKELPFFKRYYGGGASSVRGFDFNSLGSVYANGKPKGGELSILSNITLISPFFLADDSKNMRIGGFIDAGAISEKLSSFDTNDIRVSSGLAFTWLTPIGPLGLHAAKPIIKKDGDKLTTLELNLGSSF